MTPGLHDATKVAVVSPWCKSADRDRGRAQLRDYARARAAGTDARLTVGPWGHWNVLAFTPVTLRVVFRVRV